ncbi:MAG: hypothetical protein QGF38_09745, partial [Rhodospirillales bacterium]|nr:hypothetical protein [Rhodospirillales bacterium]
PVDLAPRNRLFVQDNRLDPAPARLNRCTDPRRARSQYQKLKRPAFCVPTPASDPPQCFRPVIVGGRTSGVNADLNRVTLGVM